jgi:hypothetical protein
MPGAVVDQILDGVASEDGEDGRRRSIAGRKRTVGGRRRRIGIEVKTMGGREKW